ncbi:UL36 very large tegument protein [Streptomyces sp. NPDC059176]|uniref:UL36 very large tegument protein n=1 Tax=unclassified Streptomyces TaxID=2593676 RepID=UPI00368AF995
MFAEYFRGLAGRLDRGGGWYGVFSQRDPEGMRACLDGFEVPPWDVVESLLDDLAADGDEVARARALHFAAAAAHDRRLGGAALRERLGVLRGEQARAAERGEALVRQLATLPENAPTHARLAHQLSWAKDDYARASARCAELTGRLGSLGPGVTAYPAGGGSRRVDGPQDGPGGRAAPDARGEPPAAAKGAVEERGAAPESEPRDSWFRPVGGGPDVADRRVDGREREEAPTTRTPRSRRGLGGGKRRPRGARYAWLDEDAEEPVGASEPPGPVLPVAEAQPRGARFPGGGGNDPAGTRAGDADAPEDAEAGREAVRTVAALVRLRGEGRSGEAHALLCQAAAGPAGRLPVLAAQLHRAALDADWATLLWEVASLPPGRLAAAAVALAAVGREADCGQLLRQGVARPAEEIADAVLVLHEAGAAREAAVLVEAFVRVHPPEESARIATADPHRLVPQLLSAARVVSAGRERDLVLALRAARLISG